MLLAVLNGKIVATYADPMQDTIANLAEYAGHAIVQVSDSANVEVGSNAPLGLMIRGAGNSYTPKAPFRFVETIGTVEAVLGGKNLRVTFDPPFTVPPLCWAVPWDAGGRPLIVNLAGNPETNPTVDHVDFMVNRAKAPVVAAIGVSIDLLETMPAGAKVSVRAKGY